MRRSRIVRYAAVVFAALAAVLVLSQASAAAGGLPGHPAGAPGVAARPGTVQHGTVQHGTATAVLTAMTSGARGGIAAGAEDAAGTAARTATATTATGGLCAVPGIGDIGGLLGFCSLGSSGLTGALNNICQPSLPSPEPANSGIDAMVAPPAAGGRSSATLYDRYGVAGDYWAATGLQCSDMTSLIGNNVAGMVFDVAKSIDRVTITVYQSAAGDGIVGWLQHVANKLIISLGNAIYFPYLAVVVILAAIWLAWQGLIRKRGTRTIEGTIWMIAACAAALFLIGKPADVTGLGAGVSNGISQALNVAFAKLPSPGPESCVPVQKGDPQVQPSSYSYTSGSTVVDQNADELWTVLVCKPWLVGEFGTSRYSTGSGTPTAVNTYGRSLLWAQAIAINEKPTSALIQAKQSAYAGIASSIKTNDPAIYPLFQGKQWTTRLEVGLAALFAAVVAGVLVLLISVTLILLKLSFLLLLIVGPFFLLIGTHPGFGRVVALRWVEMLIGVLLKQAAIALVLSLLLYCYALIMGTSDAVLPWALKILMIALVTIAAFIYRRPFQHLFSAVGYGVIGSQERAEADLARAGATARANSLAAATAMVPGVAAYRTGRWARRNPGQAASLALAAASGGAGAAVAAGLQPGEQAAAGAENAGALDGAASVPGAGAAGSGAAGSGAADAPGRIGLPARERALAGTTASAAAEPPPLNLPARTGAAGASPGGVSAGAVGAGAAGAAGRASAGSAAAGRVAGARSGAAAGHAATAAPGTTAASPGTPAPSPRTTAASQRSTAASPRTTAASQRSTASSPRTTAASGRSAGSAADGLVSGRAVPPPAPGSWPVGRSATPVSPASFRPAEVAPGASSVPGPGTRPAPASAPAATQRQAPPRQVPPPRQQTPRQSAPGQSAPGQPAPRQQAPGQPAFRRGAPRQPGPSEPSGRQAAGQRAAGRASRPQNPGRQPTRQPSLGGRLRARWFDSGSSSGSDSPARGAGSAGGTGSATGGGSPRGSGTVSAGSAASQQNADRQSAAPPSRSPWPGKSVPARDPAPPRQTAPAGDLAPRVPFSRPAARPLRQPGASQPAQGPGPGSDRDVPWQGQRMAGPLASPSADAAGQESERPVPFWLRSVRRK